jgi:hypothetical protein
LPSLGCYQTLNILKNHFNDFSTICLESWVRSIGIIHQKFCWWIIFVLVLNVPKKLFYFVTVYGPLRNYMQFFIRRRLPFMEQENILIIYTNQN